MTIVEATRTVTGGIDTHGEVHVAAALDPVRKICALQLVNSPREGLVIA
jgi:hypothetical protein